MAFLSNLKPVPRALAIGGGVAVIVLGAKFVIEQTPAAKYFAPAASVAIAVPDKIDLPTTVAAVQSTTAITATAPAGTEIRVKTIPWNGNSGMMHAAATGAYTARGLNVDIKREDDYPKLIADMAAFAKDPTQGSHFVIIMGDGLPAFAHGANAALKPFNSNAVAIAGIGYSRGEDKCILAAGAEVRGSLIKGYFGDGDINVCVKFASDSGIPVNVNPKLYDPNAMNLTNAGSFVEADQAFIASAQNEYKSGASCEDRTNIATGKMQKVCVNGTATWTPGDSNVFNELKKLGKSMRVLASTKEYASQMPTTIVGNKQWMAKNPDAVKAFLAATLESGEKVRGNSADLMIAAGMQAKVNGEQDASYWASMFKGTVEKGPDGKSISLGGSTTNGLGDAAFLYGLNGADNLFKRVYTVYGKMAVQYFPEIMPGGLLKYEDVVDASYLQALLGSSTNVAKAVVPTFTGAATQTFAAKSVNIEFETGKATLTAKALTVMNDVLDQAAVTALTVQANCHTDSVGNPESNLELSKARAETVKKFLITNAPGTFTNERVITRGFGDTQPIGSNAQNRRCEILLRS